METKGIKTKLKKDDEVIVIAGKQKGKRGKILFIDKTREKVFIQGVNKIKRFQRPTQDNPKGEAIEVEAGLHLTNVMYYDSKTKKGVRLGLGKDASGKKVRIIRPEGKEV